MLLGLACARLLERGITFDGRNREIISDTLAVGKAPPDLLPSPFAPEGESKAIGVEDIMAIYFIGRFERDLPSRNISIKGDKDRKRLANLNSRSRE